MIHSAKFTSGFASDLPCLKGKTFEFKEGLNVLFSPNGTGKSTALSIIGAYCSINHKSGGWSTMPEPLTIKEIGDTVKLPNNFCNLAPGECSADVKWDGTPSFINNSATDNAAKSMGHFIDDASMSPDGMITDMFGHINAMFNKSSQGQTRMNKINKMFVMLDKKPDLTINKFAKHNDSWKAVGQAFVDYIKSLNPTGRVTILLDEPEKSLSMEMQFFLWHMAFPKIAQDRQLIVATHCPLALYSKAHFIDLEEGYIEKAKRILKGGMDPENSKDVFMEVQTYLMSLIKQQSSEKKAPAPKEPKKRKAVPPSERKARPIE